jgi:hypothetical protein
LRHVETQIDIVAPAETVWRTLVDFDGYDRESWNIYIRSIDGTLQKGQKVKAVVTPLELPRMVIRATLSATDFPELRWAVKLLFPGIVHAQHYFRLESLTSSSTRLIHGERVSGALGRAFFPLVRKSRSGFIVFNEALKKKAETAHQEASRPGLS